MERTAHTVENAFTGWYDTTILVPLIISVIVPDSSFMALLKLCRSANDSFRELGLDNDYYLNQQFFVPAGLHTLYVHHYFSN
jgi:hypothetical protein